MWPVSCQSLAGLTPKTRSEFLNKAGSRTIRTSCLRTRGLHGPKPPSGRRLQGSSLEGLATIPKPKPVTQDSSVCFSARETHSTLDAPSLASVSLECPFLPTQPWLEMWEMIRSSPGVSLGPGMPWPAPGGSNAKPEIEVTTIMHEWCVPTDASQQLCPRRHPRLAAS